MGSSIGSALILATITLFYLTACDSGSSSGSNPEEDGRMSPDINDFPPINVSFPQEFTLVSIGALDAETTVTQNFLRTVIFADGSTENVEVLCDVNFSFTNAETAAQLYSDLINNSNISVISLDGVQNGGKPGQQLTYSQVVNDNFELSGLARTFYFNDLDDQLTRSSYWVVDCNGATGFFNQHRELIDEVMSNIRFDAISENASDLMTIEMTATGSANLL